MRSCNFFPNRDRAVPTCVLGRWYKVLKRGTQISTTPAFFKISRGVKVLQGEGRRELPDAGRRKCTRSRGDSGTASLLRTCHFLTRDTSCESSLAFWPLGLSYETLCPENFFKISRRISMLFLPQVGLTLRGGFRPPCPSRNANCVLGPRLPCCASKRFDPPKTSTTHVRILPHSNLPPTRRHNPARTKINPGW